MNTKSKWIVDRLKRRGYVIVSTDEQCAHLCLGSYSPCTLTISVDDKSYQQTATFRPVLEPDIHITRYLRLGELKDWIRLEEFEVFFRKHEMRVLQREEKCPFCSYVGVPVEGRDEGLMACANCGAQ